jgi:hypothetical protein
MIGSLRVVRDAVMVTMSTTDAHYFSNEVRRRNLYGPEKKKLRLLFEPTDRYLIWVRTKTFD